MGEKTDKMKQKAKESASRVKRFFVLNNMKSAMQLESKQFKIAIIVVACVLGFFYLMFASLWFARFDSANKGQIGWEDYEGRSIIESQVGGSVVAYDVVCLTGGEYSDNDKARDYAEKFYED